RRVDSLIMTQYGNQITDLQYPQVLVSSISEKTKIFGIAFIIISVLLCLIVIFSIDNTIRLAMFSNRFLIKTMQMVGATRNFIALSCTLLKRTPLQTQNNIHYQPYLQRIITCG